MALERDAREQRVSAWVGGSVQGRQGKGSVKVEEGHEGPLKRGVGGVPWSEENGDPPMVVAYKTLELLAEGERLFRAIAGPLLLARGGPVELAPLLLVH